ncbi:hypothetical protein N7468_000230 [Penicillium chermesinum]|uniref:Uncharacterized protein n=1 Tax=Penicillium chermesinum TaxID=63820 RepID=A0A9W9TYM5_9EURO|nr:uncharacterized protein N7468_000230 [Penicillium chermesinum]KAJ5248779.1 hypothetical protein N7468_000230 [Penicillium chermesinum]
MVFGGDNGGIVVQDTTTGGRRTIQEGNARLDRITVLAITADGKTVASVCSSGPVSLWDTVTGKRRHILGRKGDRIQALAFSPNGGQIASGAADGTIQIWNSTKGEMISTSKSHTCAISTLEFSPGGKQIASGSMDGAVQIGTIVRGRLEVLKTVKSHNTRIETLTFSPDKVHIASGAVNGTIIIHNAQTGRYETRLDGHLASIISLSFSSDSKLLASLCRGLNIRLWDLGGYLQSTKYSSFPPKRVQLRHPRNNHIISASAFTSMIKFAEGDQYLITNLGPIWYKGHMVKGQGEGFEIYIDGGWIYFGAKRSYPRFEQSGPSEACTSLRLLLLPSGVRPECCEVGGDQVKIGISDDQMLTLTVDRKALLAMMRGKTQSRPGMES